MFAIYFYKIMWNGIISLGPCSSLQQNTVSFCKMQIYWKQFKHSKHHIFQCYVLMLFKIKRADIDGLNFTMQGPFVIYAEF